MAPVMTREQAKELKPLVVATAVYFVLFYVFMCFQSFAKLYLLFSQKQKKDKDSEKRKSLREIKYDSKRGLGLISDRTFLNLVEQAPACLASLWLYGLFVDVNGAATLMYWYVAARALYPFVYAKGPPLLLLSTFPNYAVIFYALTKATLAVVF